MPVPAFLREGGAGIVRLGTNGFETKAGKESEIVSEETKSNPSRAGGAKARAVTLAAIIAAWLALDAATKAVFLAYPANALVGGPYFGLVDFRVVHNTGGAWGVFSNSTAALGVFSLVVCAALAVYFAKTVREQGWLATVGIALIIAGGIGNALDRFIRGFVMDFIEFSFFSFPVFNVADIGVTCGFVLLILGIAIYGVRDDDTREGEQVQSAAASLSEGERPSVDAASGEEGSGARVADAVAQSAEDGAADGGGSAGER